jgi:hypothetical protein
MPFANLSGREDRAILQTELQKTSSQSSASIETCRSSLAAPLSLIGISR